MKPMDRNSSARILLIVGLVAGAGLVPSASMSDSTAPVSPEVAITAPAPEAPPRAQGEADPAQVPVSYSREQADRGEEKFTSACKDCHGDNLRGGMNGGAPLRGMAFEEKYANGAPASWMFEYMSTAMPPNSPGRYSPETYADLMAYILKVNGFQAGAPLPSDPAALDNLVVEK